MDVGKRQLERDLSARLARRGGKLPTADSSTTASKGSGGADCGGAAAGGAGKPVTAAVARLLKAHNIRQTKYQGEFNQREERLLHMGIKSPTRKTSSHTRQKGMTSDVARRGAQSLMTKSFEEKKKKRQKLHDDGSNVFHLLQKMCD